MPNKYGKILFYCSIMFLFIIIYVTLKDLVDNKIVKKFELRNTHSHTENVELTQGKQNNMKKIEKDKNIKYILQWTSSHNVPFVDMGKGQQGFINRNCSHVNCFVTDDQYYLGDITKFDVVAFAGPEVGSMSEESLPKKRSHHQKYVFGSIESSHNYPVCSNRFDNYFNWTWTYKLDSQVHWGYIVIRDKNQNIIGPKTDMHWLNLNDMDPISDELKTTLNKKTKAAAWFVSNCYSRSQREKFVHDLENELKKYEHAIDIYGKCGLMSCDRNNEEKCNKVIEDKYFFYLSFENSFDEDYVTEKLLHPLRNNAIPIVYGAANYTRFMPDGIYLNARELGVAKLAEKMNELIQNPDKYHEYFKWKKYYIYHKTVESVQTNEYCRMCELLNDENALRTTSIYKDFRKWWNPPNMC